MGTGGREFSVGRLAGCRIHFAESTLAALRQGLRMNLKMQTHGKHGKEIRPTQNTPRKPQQPGERDDLETEREKTRPTRSFILARFHIYRVCGNRPRTAVAISKNDEFNVIRTRTHIPIDKLNNGILYERRYQEAFCLKAKNGLCRFAPSVLPHY